MSLSNKAKNYIRKYHAKKSAAKLASDLDLDESEVQKFINEISEPLPLKKKIAFYAITVSIPILFFVIIEFSLRATDYLGNTDLFMDPQIPSAEYYIPNPNFAARYFFYTNTIPSPSTDVFLKEKPRNGYRVFAMGGSSAAGYPYGYNGTFSRVVDDILSDAMPDKEVEIVNVATSAINTYTLFDQVDEILQHQPDAIIMYTGHNEFYGALGVGSNENLGGFPGFVRFYLKLQRFKTFLFLREQIVNTGQLLFGSDENKNSSATLMERIIRDQAIELDSPQHELAMRQFRSNMQAMFDRFSNNGVDVYLATIASNVKDQPPFVSIEDGDHPPASQLYVSALENFSEENFSDAASEFEYAKDLDGLKFRAPTQINEIIMDLAGQYENVHLVPVHQTFMENSDHGIIGEQLMLEHLHPNKLGYFLMGKTFSEVMMKDLSTKLQLENVDDLENYYDKMYITDYDDRIIYHRIRTLKQGFPFVLDGNTGRYQSDYSPVDLIDSLAFEVVHNNKRWDEAKVEIGQYYESAGDINAALDEYYGLIRNQPWNDSPYVFAARVFLNRNDFMNAKPLLEKAYELAPSESFTTKMLGAVELDAGNSQRAIKLLEESRALRPNDAQMLYNLSGAYGTNQEFEKALEIADKVVEINPNFPGIQQWRQQLIRIINSRKGN